MITYQLSNYLTNKPNKSTKQHKTKLETLKPFVYKSGTPPTSTNCMTALWLNRCTTEPVQGSFRDEPMNMETALHTFHKCPTDML